jgi:ferritin-like metal-binding protein YciE
MRPAATDEHVSCTASALGRQDRGDRRESSITDTGGTRMAMQTIEELFEHELKDIYSAEHALLAALEQMADESSDRDIRKVFSQHRKETQAQIKRLEKIFKTMGQKPEAETCPGIEGLIKEKKAFVREKPSAELLEFYNIGAAQKTERYEITAYETLIDMADKLGMLDAVDLLEHNLQEEEAALNRLKAIASEFDVAEEAEADENVRDEEEDTLSSRR